jgi:hypothetical protein
VVIRSNPDCVRIFFFACNFKCFIEHRYCYYYYYYYYYYYWHFFSPWEELTSSVQVLSTLILSHITSKYHTVAIFFIFDLSTIFHTQFVDIFMINLRTKFDMSSSSDSLVIAIKPKPKLHAAAMLFYILQKKYPVTEIAYFSKIRPDFSALY